MKNMIDYRQPKKKGEKNQERDCFRGLAFKNGYLEYPLRDNSAISVGFWGDYISVKPHRHAYYEFALIKKGSCIHNCKGTNIPLVPGDVFLIPPHCEHSYEIQAEVEIYNCNFIAEGLSEEFNGILEELFENNGEKMGYETVILNDVSGMGMDRQRTELAIPLLKIEEKRPILEDRISIFVLAHPGRSLYTVG